MKIGILAVQGAFIEHSKMLDKMGIDNFEIRKKADLRNEMDGLILPGGESTVIGKLMKELDLFSILQTKIEEGLPVFGTCAGMILLARELANDAKSHLATMPIRVKRNAYGRQLGSFYKEADFVGIGEIPMRFIRAPYIENVGDDVEPLAFVNDNIVAARYKNQLVTSFHPELTNSSVVHQYFIDIVEQNCRL